MYSILMNMRLFVGICSEEWGSKRRFTAHCADSCGLNPRIMKARSLERGENILSIVSFSRKPLNPSAVHIRK
jgi:hypothetical protein